MNQWVNMKNAAPQARMAISGQNMPAITPHIAAGNHPMLTPSRKPYDAMQYIQQPANVSAKEIQNPTIYHESKALPSDCASAAWLIAMSPVLLSLYSSRSAPSGRYLCSLKYSSLQRRSPIHNYQQPTVAYRIVRES